MRERFWKEVNDQYSLLYSENSNKVLPSSIDGPLRWQPRREPIELSTLPAYILISLFTNGQPEPRCFVIVVSTQSNSRSFRESAERVPRLVHENVISVYNRPSRKNQELIEVTCRDEKVLFGEKELIYLYIAAHTERRAQVWRERVHRERCCVRARCVRVYIL